MKIKYPISKIIGQVIFQETIPVPIAVLDGLGHVEARRDEVSLKPCIRLVQQDWLP